MIRLPMLIGGEEVFKDEVIDVIYPYNQQKVGEAVKGSVEDVEKAVEKAKVGLKKLKQLTAYEKYKILLKVAQLLEERKDEFAKVITLETGKTIKESRVEVERAINTITFSAEEAKRIGGEVVHFDASPNGRGKRGYYFRVPAGIVAAITPFNFPVNLTAHKIAPAIAAGCPFILKPSEKTPLSPTMLCQLFLEAGVPKEAVSIIPGFADVGQAMTTHPDVRVVSFTGSLKVGEIIAKQAGLKKIVMELGSNSAVIVDKDANLELAAKKSVLGGFALAGQVCISVQRVLVHKEVADEFENLLKKEASKLKYGDPMEEDTDVGPVISINEVDRIQTWISEAVMKGAKVSLGGQAEKTLFKPTIVSEVPEDSKLFYEEAFAPVVAVKRFETIEEAIEMVNKTNYGLQVGIFTNNLKNAWKVIEEVEVGGVMVNDIPTFRADNMPYGGVKGSGIGREGPKFAIEDYTEIKVVAFDLNA
ncbi:aldehyde dehydrogenase family protein [Sulfurihydrogenibium azorense]|uniref:Succinate-semialdehyde dehydrogenase [NADP+] (Ssdh) n=1 Tax=Sulfurihydrogenibium azorense (strain DSM 15241 / OCM 825 / Az-Fu1) TaxID=204536 RepID=C1DXB4_SULAA|nr:aldehyde dehydrogenase family protein [Sulfurihydrogenibium azorense]ACN99592.1 succinate-semialdehyde dehydrogenase [NADP+] (ssdh) [Sulfurihydrogenibium azorense Az-Fu1]MDM7274012.1 aldehyde dehydrogenase family protein [Sulfurihydrogenibium azorense]